MNHKKKLAAYGQEFEDEEEGSIVSKKPTAVQDQIATDENGKRRFHGAFTGGFSAGYWNTVGSRHGWVPQVYSSSRDSRSDKVKQRAEDFMDAEDLGEFGIGNRHIQRTSQFGGDFGRKRMAWERGRNEKEETSGLSEISEMFEDIVKPVNDSIGARMLNRMGWRQGKGIGLSNLKSKKGRVSNFDREQASKIVENHEFSQEDSLVQQLVPVQGSHGIGYQGLAQTGVLDQKYGQNVTSLRAENNKKGKGIKGQAFGVGVFEEDDDSVYSNYDLSQFDFSLDPTNSQSIDDPSTSNRKIDTAFEMQPKRQNARKFYAPPRLPPNFRGDHKCQPMDVRKLPDGMKSEVKTMTTMQRAKFLGEDRVSVMELIPSKDRRKLERKGRSRWDIKAEQEEVKGQSGKNNRGGEVDEENDRRLRNRIEFPEEPIKQSRFKEYLHYLRRGLSYPQPTDLSVWEWESEKKEFETKLLAEERAMLPEVRSRAQPLARCAIAAPIHEILASKFVKESKGELKVGQKDEDKLAAVKMEMFGDRTRQSFDWYPDSLLSKRFNVPHPYPGSDGIVGVPTLQKSIGSRPKNTLMMDLGLVEGGLPSTASELEQKMRIRRDEIKQVELVTVAGKDENQQQNDPGSSSSSDSEPEQGEPEKAPKSFFDYVFGGGVRDDDSLSSDSDSEEEREKEKRRERRKVEEIKRREQEIAKEREREEKRKEDNHRKSVTIQEIDEKEEEDDEVVVLSSSKNPENNEQYGPAIPENLDEQPKLNAFSVLKYLQDDLKKRRDDKKKHKKDKKHKKKSKKSKKKSKKITTSSEESSWEEEK